MSSVIRESFCSFFVGQKVVCIDDEWEDPKWLLIPNRPVANAVYTIRDFEPDFFQDGFLAIRLEEIRNEKLVWLLNIGVAEMEGAFGVDRFRPFVERKTDISIFTKILDDAREKEPLMTDDTKTKLALS